MDDRGQVTATAAGEVGAVAISDRVVAPPEVVVTATGYRGLDVRLVLRARWGGFDCVELTARQAPGGQPVSSEALRRVQVSTLMQQAWQLLGFRDDDGVVVARGGGGGALPLAVRQSWPAKDRALALRHAALAYEVAAAAGQQPTKAVQSAFAVSRATASRMIAEARERGLITAPAPRRADEGPAG